MKRFFAVLLVLTLLPLYGSLAASKDQLPKLYTARTVLQSRVYTSWEGTSGSNSIGTVPAKAKVIVHALYPAYALITYDRNKVTGYVSRKILDEAVPVNSATTPPYGVDFNHFICRIEADDAPVTSKAGGGDTLITLHKGARVSFIGFEKGYGKLIFHRQYGYIDSRLLGELTPINESPESAKKGSLIAAYTSFYNIATTESNLNRMTNIAVACEKLGHLPLKTREDLDFNRDVGPYRASNGYLPAGVLIDGKLQQGYGGGTCQVSSTLYNVVLQLPGLTVLQRRPHGANGASYLPMGVDAAVGNSYLNFRFRNEYPFTIRIDGTSQDGALTIAIYRAS